MAFETDISSSPRTARPSVAVVGGGISGLGAAWRLAQTCNVTLYEEENRLGGHARTIMAGPDRDVPVDTGFMVFNDQTYPDLIRLFETLQVPSKPAPMSFAVSLDEGRFEYGLTNLARVFADPKNAISPRFFRLLGDILKFNSSASQSALPAEKTLGDLIEELGVGPDFTTHYLYPLAGAIWSTARDDMAGFPARTFVRFFENHGLLSAHGGPKWRTVDGGSRTYVEKLTHWLTANGVRLHCSSTVEAVGRSPQPWVKIVGQDMQTFDHVVLASHSNQSLQILQDATPEERSVLSAVKYRPNRAFLHADARQMPLRRNAWSSWVYKGQTTGTEDSGSFTYWMNALQSIPQTTPLFVSLNPKQEIPDHLIYDEANFDHPQFDLAAIDAQEKLGSIQGRSNIWFCGAWTRYGFHEDGLHSGLRTADALRNQSALGRELVS